MLRMIEGKMNPATPSRVARQRFFVLLLFALGGLCARSIAQLTVTFPSSSTAPQSKELQSKEPLSVDDVIKLSKAGLRDDVIIAQIKKRLQPFDLTADQLVALKNAHVSERVIETMVGTSVAPTPAGKTASVVPDAPRPVSVPNEVQSLSDGFYYRSSQGWKRLEPISMAGGGLKHAGKMFVPGLTPQMVWTFRGAEAPVQIEGKKPTFCVKELPSLASVAGRSERDLVIVRFDKKKDHRELQTTNGGNMFTFKAGLSKDRTPDITTKTIADGVFIVSPNEDLRPGEYMLTFGALGNSGYDFGVKQ
jgi:hypothetical protein